jgi:hypothetical protein
MADLLVKHLKYKSSKHSALSLLASQWDFDEKLIPKALQNISGLFPHYSRHDESHSKQILINIERLLGKNIKLLSATDTWLILEAAYWHDIGMVVPHADLQKAVNEPGFSDYIDSICSQPNHDLHAFAFMFKNKSDSGLIFEHGCPIEMLGKLRELLAEWFRKKHPERAEQIVRSPMSSIGLSSPRTELIPARLISLLGRVCQMHGSAFKNLLAPHGLPFRESGLGKDDCHPRFVACLLRMGDLLDLDDNRFCPVMQGIAGEHRSPLSKAHEDKHAGIRHLRIDPERIELSAECETIDGYLEAFKWFDWLQQEVSDQRNNWRDIVPNRKLGLLPMVGPVSVKLSGGLQILKDGERPSFTLDAEKAIELLQGRNLYESKFSCIREILQNAVDATLLKIWLVNGKAPLSAWEAPETLELSEFFKSHAITVTLEEVAVPEGSSPGQSTWELKIRDHGTGITQSDLEFMFRIGGSQKNLNRQKNIRQMPEWMKPSGAFGIGLQSAFMLCDELTIVTKNIADNEIFDITMYDPVGPRNGLIIFRKLPVDISEPYGTVISLRFNLDAFSKSWLVDFDDQNAVASKVARKLDPLLDDLFPYEAAELFDKVVEFSKNSLIKIDGALITCSDKYEMPDLYRLNFGEQTGEWNFIKTKHATLRLRYKPGLEDDDTPSCIAYYRGQRFLSGNIYFPNVNIEIDIMSGNAGAWLNFSRDEISQGARERLRDAALEALYLVVRNDILAGEPLKVFNSLGCKPYEYAIFLKSMELQYGEDWRVLADVLQDTWLDFKPKGQSKKIRELFSLPEWRFAIRHNFASQDPNEFDFFVYPSSHELLADIIFMEWLKKPNNSIKTTCAATALDFSLPGLDEEEGGRTLITLHHVLSSEPQEPWDKDALSHGLLTVLRNCSGNSRYFIDASQEFEGLALVSNVELNAFNIFDHDIGRDKVLLPFLFLTDGNYKNIRVELKAEQLEKISRWTQHRLKVPMELSRIRKAYESLVTYIDKEVMKDSKEWRSARTLTE